MDVLNDVRVPLLTVNGRLEDYPCRSRAYALLHRFAPPLHTEEAVVYRPLGEIFPTLAAFHRYMSALKDDLVRMLACDPANGEEDALTRSALSLIRFEPAEDAESYVACASVHDVVVYNVPHLAAMLKASQNLDIIYFILLHEFLHIIFDHPCLINNIFKYYNIFSAGQAQYYTAVKLINQVYDVEVNEVALQFFKRAEANAGKLPDPPVLRFAAHPDYRIPVRCAHTIPFLKTQTCFSEDLVATLKQYGISPAASPTAQLGTLLRVAMQHHQTLTRLQRPPLGFEFVRKVIANEADRRAAARSDEQLRRTLDALRRRVAECAIPTSEELARAMADAQAHQGNAEAKVAALRHLREVSDALIAQLHSAPLVSPQAIGEVFIGLVRRRIALDLSADAEALGVRLETLRLARALAASPSLRAALAALPAAEKGELESALPDLCTDDEATAKAQLDEFGRLSQASDLPTRAFRLGPFALIDLEEKLRTATAQSTAAALAECHRLLCAAFEVPPAQLGDPAWWEGFIAAIAHADSTLQSLRQAFDAAKQRDPRRAKTTSRLVSAAVVLGDEQATANEVERAEREVEQAIADLSPASPSSDVLHRWQAASHPPSRVAQAHVAHEAARAAVAELIPGFDLERALDALSFSRAFYRIMSNPVYSAAAPLTRAHLEDLVSCARAAACLTGAQRTAPAQRRKHTDKGLTVGPSAV